MSKPTLKKALKTLLARPKDVGVVLTTGYFVPPPGGYKSKAEAAMEGGALDCLGNPLRTLEDYDPGEPGSYVSIATDPRFIAKRALVTMEGMIASDGTPIHFVACDVGSAIKGAHIDICCAAEKMTNRVTRNRAVSVIGSVKLVAA